jgi:hypothetical protein
MLGAFFFAGVSNVGQRFSGIFIEIFALGQNFG